MECSRGKEDCKTCTKEGYDKWNNSPPPKEKFNPWLCHNERIRDIIRWDELVIEIVFFLVMWMIVGLFWSIVGFIFMAKMANTLSCPLLLQLHNESEEIEATGCKYCESLQKNTK